MKWPWSRKVEAERPVVETAVAPVVHSEDELLSAMQRPDLTRETFFLLYSRLVELRLRPERIRFLAEDELEVELADGKPRKAFLSNLWVQVKSDPANVRDLVNRYLSSFAAMSSDEEILPTRIVPMVKDQVYMDLPGLQTNLVSQHLAGDLWIVFAVDWPTRMTTFLQSDLERLGIARDRLLPLAIENLGGILPPVECHGEGPWFLLSAGDYTASLLLLEYIWGAVAEQVAGDLVAVVPARDNIFFTGSQSSEGITAIRQQAREVVANGHHVVSDTLLRRSGSSWVVFD